MKVITIADFTAWLGLNTTKTRGLSFRAVLVPGVLITSRGEVSTSDHLEYLAKIGLGAKKDDIWVLEGDHPIQALLDEPNHMTLGRIVDLISAKGFKIEFFETGKQDAEEQVVEEIAFHLGISPEDCWKQYIYSNNPKTAYLGAKAEQRKLANAHQARELFAVNEVVSTKPELYRAASRFGPKQKLMIRLDGGASSDDQFISPNSSLDLIWQEIGEKGNILVEPYFEEHIALGALIRLTEQGVEFIGASDQLTVKCPQSGKPISFGNLLFTEPTSHSVFTAQVFAHTKELSIRFGDLLWQEGVRGCLSVDLLLLPTGKLYITEVNIRMTNGWYGYHALSQLRQNTQPICVGLNVFKPKKKEVDSFSALINCCGQYLYTAERIAGCIPVVTTLLPAQCHMLIVAPTVEQYQELMHTLWRQLGCEGDPPQVLRRQQVASARVVS